MWLRRLSSGFVPPKKGIAQYIPALAAIGSGVAFVGILNNFGGPSDLIDPFSTSPEEDGELLKAAKSPSPPPPVQVTAASADNAAALPIMGSGKWHEVTKAPVAAPAPSYPSWAAHLLRGLWRVDTASIAANNPMEDRTVVEPCGEGILCGVFDGHYGPRMSEFARQNTHEIFNKAVDEESRSGRKDLTSCMKRYFALMEEAWTQNAQRIIKAGDWTPAMEGSCAVMAYVTQDRLVLGNLGDSRAILVRQEEPGGELSIEQLTNEHNVRDYKERLKLQSEHPEDDNAATFVRDARAWYVCGLLQVTRSLGDLFLKKMDYFRLLPSELKPPGLSLDTFRPPYVSSDPEVVSRRLDSRDLYLVIGSDGLWDELKNPEVLSLLVGKPSEPSLTRSQSGLRLQTQQQQQQQQTTLLASLSGARTDADGRPRKPTITEMVRDLEDRMHITRAAPLVIDPQEVSNNPAAFLQPVRTAGGGGAPAVAHATWEEAMHECTGAACGDSMPPEALLNAGQRLLWGALQANRVAQRNGVEQLLQIPQGRGRRQIHDDISIVVVLLRPAAAAASGKA